MNGLFFSFLFSILGSCAKYTGGSIYYYPAFNAARSEDALKFATEFSHFLGRPIGLEAVMRVRASKGKSEPFLFFFSFVKNVFLLLNLGLYSSKSLIIFT